MFQAIVARMMRQNASAIQAQANSDGDRIAQQQLFTVSESPSTNMSSDLQGKDDAPVPTQGSRPAENDEQGSRPAEETTTTIFAAEPEGEPSDGIDWGVPMQQDDQWQEQEPTCSYFPLDWAHLREIPCLPSSKSRVTPA